MFIYFYSEIVIFINFIKKTCFSYIWSHITKTDVDKKGGLFEIMNKEGMLNVISELTVWHLPNQR